MAFLHRGFLLALLFLAPVPVLRGADTSFPDGADPAAGVGVNIHFTDARPGELEMLAQGFHWIRTDFTWEHTEKSPGVYDFSAYDRLLASLDRFHLRAVWILDYGNPLYDHGLPPCTDADRAAFARWAVAAVAHFQGRGILWEIWNEPNGSFWKPKADAEAYARLALAASQAIHDAYPNEIVVGPALSGTDMKFLDVVGRAGLFAFWSGVTIHPYRHSGPETDGDAYEKTRRLIQNHAGPGRPPAVLCGEMGYTTTWPGIDEATQGKYLARLFLFDVLSGIPLTIWYDWHDDGTNPADAEHRFGIVRYEYHPGAAPVYDPKPAYAAACTYTGQLSGYRFRERIKTDSAQDYVLAFSRNGQTCLAAWTAGAAHAVTIPAPDGAYAVTDFDGKEEPDLRASSGALTLTLDGGPRYLKLR